MMGRMKAECGMSDTMKAAPVRSLLVLVLAITLIAACATHPGFPPESEVVPAFDTPAQFTAVMGEADAVLPDGACSTRLYDPRDHGELQLIRSVSQGPGGAARGDYQVRENKYGVNRHELLRIDCATGVPVGIVRR
jgi:hypothetical protein